MDFDVTTGLCSRVVLDLVEGLKQDGLYLFTDKYYTSPQLALKKGINIYGTVLTNRKLLIW